MSQMGLLYALGCPTHLLGLPSSFDQVNVNLVKPPHPLPQKKKTLSFLLSQSLETCPKNISIATAADRSNQVMSSLDP